MSIFETLFSALVTPIIRVDDPDAPDMTNYQLVLNHWGIHSPKDLNDTKRTMREQLLLGFALMATSLYFFLKTDLNAFMMFIYFMLGIVLCATRTWRLWVFRKKRFVPFAWWITGRWNWPANRR